MNSATALYKESTIRRLSIYFGHLLAAIVSRPDAKIAELDLLTAEEKEQVLSAFNPAQLEAAPAATFHRLFEKQAESTPEAEAVVYENNRLTYAELNERANCLAATLRGSGIGREEIVGILAERSGGPAGGRAGRLESGRSVRTASTRIIRQTACGLCSKTAERRCC
ncbi:AMP-binding protein [Paenibacillus amylolyticus]|nr:AMP-binding protein [Paenibacillus amylolyticus]